MAWAKQGTSDTAMSSKYGSGESTMLNIYQKYISPIDGATCRMRPTCSQYSKISFKNENAISAFYSTTDRLIRCGHDLEGNYPATQKNGKTVYHDPHSINSNNHYHFTKNYLINNTSRDNSNDTRSPNNEIKFADHLFLSHKYQLALLEYERLLFAETELSKQHYYQNQISKCYFHLNDYASLNKLYKQLLRTKHASREVKNNIRFLMGKHFYLKKDYEKSQNYLNINTDKSSAQFKAEVNYLMGLNDLHLGNWDLAEVKMKAIQPNTNLYTQAQNYYSIQDEINKLPRKSPATAGWLSAVIPGAGYMYTNRPGTGIAALIINSLFIWASVESFQNKQYAIFATTALLGSGWYVGAIKGSYNAGVRFNIKQIQNLLSSKQKKINTKQSIEREYVL